MDRAVIVYTNYPDVVEAEAAAESILKARLAACANILPGAISRYWWEGEIARAEEATMILKTRASLAESVRTAIRAGHSYATPAIVVIPLESVDRDYLAWILQETAAAPV
jgi:periplasmic divalent cation tolerance protein